MIAGDPLVEVQAEAENGLAFGKRVGFGYVIHVCGSELGLVRTLRGLTATFGGLSHDEYDELDTERQLAGQPDAVACRVLLLDAQDAGAVLRRRLRSGRCRRWAGAAAAVDGAIPNRHGGLSLLCGAWPMPPAWNVAAAEGQALHMEALAAHHAQLEVWAEHCPANFADRTMLVRAEVARIEGRLVDAEKLYETAVRLAHANGSVHNAAVSNELAGRFYAARGFEGIATAYLRDARSCYRRWGADGKVRQLEQRYPQIGIGRSRSPMRPRRSRHQSSIWIWPP